MCYNAPQQFRYDLNRHAQKSRLIASTIRSQREEIRISQVAADLLPMMYVGLLSVTDGTSLANGKTLRILSRSHPLLMIGHKRVKGKSSCLFVAIPDQLPCSVSG